MKTETEPPPAESLVSVQSEVEQLRHEIARLHECCKNRSEMYDELRRSLASPYDESHKEVCDRAARLEREKAAVMEALMRLDDNSDLLGCQQAGLELPAGECGCDGCFARAVLAAIKPKGEA